MNAIADFSKYFFYNFFYSFYCIFCPSIVYLLALCGAGFFITLLLSKFFSMRWQDILKSFFCSTLIMFAVLGMWGLLIVNALQGSIISMIIDELHCILIIIASIFFIRTKPNKLSWLWGILLALFAWPVINQIARIIALNANFLEMKRISLGSALLLIMALVHTMVMMFALRHYLKNDSLKKIKFFTMVFVIMLTVNGCAAFLTRRSEGWFAFYTPRVVPRGFIVQPKKMVDEITNK